MMHDHVALPACKLTDPISAVLSIPGRWISGFPEPGIDLTVQGVLWFAMCANLHVYDALWKLIGRLLCFKLGSNVPHLGQAAMLWDLPRDGYAKSWSRILAHQQRNSSRGLAIPGTRPFANFWYGGCCTRKSYTYRGAVMRL